MFTEELTRQSCEVSSQGYSKLIFCGRSSGVHKTSPSDDVVWSKRQEREFASDVVEYLSFKAWGEQHFAHDVCFDVFPDIGTRMFVDVVDVTSEGIENFRILVG